MGNIKRDWQNNSLARFVCCMTIFWPDGKSYLGKGTVNGKISTKKRGNNGFGYDPIFIPHGYNKTFGELKPQEKLKIDHRSKAFLKISNLFIDF